MAPWMVCLIPLPGLDSKGILLGAVPSSLVNRHNVQNSTCDSQPVRLPGERTSHSNVRQEGFTQTHILFATHVQHHVPFLFLPLWCVLLSREARVWSAQPPVCLWHIAELHATVRLVGLKKYNISQSQPLNPGGKGGDPHYSASPECGVYGCDSSINLGGRGASKFLRLCLRDL